MFREHNVGLRIREIDSCAHHIRWSKRKWRRSTTIVRAAVYNASYCKSSYLRHCGSTTLSNQFILNLKHHFRTYAKSTSVRNGKVNLGKNCSSSLLKYVNINIWNWYFSERGVLYLRNTCTPTRCNFYTKMIIPAGKNIVEWILGMRNSDTRFLSL